MSLPGGWGQSWGNAVETSPAEGLSCGQAGLGRVAVPGSTTSLWEPGDDLRATAPALTWANPGPSTIHSPYNHFPRL
jgi:hypothetical protein